MDSVKWTTNKKNKYTTEWVRMKKIPNRNLRDLIDQNKGKAKVQVRTRKGKKQNMNKVNLKKVLIKKPLKTRKTRK